MKRLAGFCFLGLALLLLSLTGCAKRIKPAAAPVVLPQTAGVHHCSKPREDMTRVLRAGMTVLYFDETSGSIALYDANSKQLWRALPEAETPDAAMLTMDLLVNGQPLTLNSQDHCAKENGVSMRKTDDGLQLTYRFAATLPDDTKLQLPLTLTVRVTEGCMHLSADCAALQQPTLPRGVLIQRIALLPFFGAQQSGEQEDFLLLPDGCGSVVRTAPTPKTFPPMAIPVYTPDENGAAACVASFGQRCGEGAFVALAEDGDALMTVHAEKRTKAGGFNRVFSSFTLCRSAQDARGDLFLSRHPYDGMLTLSYRFLAGDAACAAGMAAACREMLIRNGTLDLLSPIRNDTAYPFHVSLIGAAVVQTPEEPHAVLQTLTDFSQARTVLEYLRSKDIPAIRLCYRGMFLGGLAQHNERVSSTVSLGQSMASFVSEMEPLGVRVFPELRLLSAQNPGPGQSAKTLFGRKATQVDPLLPGNCLSAAAVLTTCSADSLPRRSAALLADLRKHAAGAVCIADAAQQLYTDEGSRLAPNAPQMCRLIGDQLSLFAAKQDLMLHGANLYAVKYASSLLEIPLTATYTNALTSPVPFLPAILHGYTFYAGQPMNLADDPQLSLLLAAQCGAVPYYEWYAADFSTQTQPDALSYVQTISQAQQTYAALRSLLDGLSGQLITAFSQPANGVTCTTFGKVRIYVNFNDKAVRADGVRIPARSALRVAQ